MIDINFLRNLPFFSAWDDSALLKIRPYCTLMQLKQNIKIVQQDASSRDLYILIKGSLLLKETIGANQITFGSLTAGELFGELAFIDGEKRVCDVISDKPSEVLSISSNIINSDQELYNKISIQLLKNSAERARETNKSLIESLLNQLKLLQTKINTARLFVLCIFLFIIMMLVNRFLYTSHINPYSAIFAWSYLAILAIPFAILMFMNKVSPAFIGLSTQGIQKKLLICFIVAIPFVLVIYALSALKLQKSLLDFSGIIDMQRIYSSFIFRYFMIAFFQQVFRGVLQTCLSEIFTTYIETKAIFMTAFMFGVMHIHLGYFAILITSIAGLLFGYIYSIQHNTYSVTLLHGIIGSAAFTFHLI